MSTTTPAVGLFYLVRFGDNPAAVVNQRNASLKIDGDEIDVSTKDSDFWKEHLPGFRSWSLDCDAVLVGVPGSTTQSDIITQLLAASTTYAALVDVDIYLNSTQVAGGTATIKSLEIGLPYQAEGTFKATFSGSGALTCSLV